MAWDKQLRIDVSVAAIASLVIGLLFVSSLGGPHNNAPAAPPPDVVVPGVACQDTHNDFWNAQQPGCCLPVKDPFWVANRVAGCARDP